MRAAAVLVVAAGGALIWSRPRDTGVASAPSLALATTTTAPGERKTLTLADGSEVVLSPGSALTVLPGYAVGDSGQRRVTVEGEAFFRVTHDERRPFQVMIASAIVEDLGTEFVVRAFPTDSALRVVVASGAVSVRRNATGDTAAVLSPRDVGTLRASGAMELRRGVDVTPYLAFASGKLVFNDAPLSEVALELARWYGLEVRIADRALRDRHYTGSFDSESLDEVLRVIGLTLDIHFRRGDGWIEFTTVAPAASPARSPASGATAAPARHEAGV